MRSIRARTLGVSSSSCLSVVVKNGSEEAIKSRQPTGFFDVNRDRLQIVRERRRRGHDLLELADYVPLQVPQSQAMR